METDIQKMGMGMEIAIWEWEGTGIKNPFPNISIVWTHAFLSLPTNLVHGRIRARNRTIVIVHHRAETFRAEKIGVLSDHNTSDV